MKKIIIILILVIFLILVGFILNQSNETFISRKNIIVVSYSNGGIHEINQNDLDKTVKKLNYKHVMYKDSMITDFINENKEIFKYSRGGGYWLWKPYIILRELEKMEDTDILLYVDSGSHLLAPIDSLLDKYSEDMIIFNSCCMTKTFTKRDLLVLFDADKPKITMSKQVEAGFIIMRKGAIPIIRKWLEVGRDPHMIMDSASKLVGEYSEFKEHRHDQSIIDILAKQSKNVRILSDKGKYVNHHRRRK